MQWMSGDGKWVVVLIRRSVSNGRDGEWLRVSHRGFYVGEARDWDGVARLGVDVADLREALEPSGWLLGRRRSGCLVTYLGGHVGGYAGR